MIRIQHVTLSLDEDESLLTKRAAKKIGVPPAAIREISIQRRAIDARGDTVRRVYTVDVAAEGEQRILARRRRGVDAAPDVPAYHVPEAADTHRGIIVVGTGPAGLFAAYALVLSGLSPLILERGPEMAARTRAVESFWRNGDLDPEANVQFGEGGAGTFSDGKLNSGIHDPRCRFVLDTFADCGASDDILINSKPHVGTDRVRACVTTLRERIITLGGQFRFNSLVTDLVIKDGTVTGVMVNDTERLSCDALILAVGHSARDTFAMLHERGAALAAKPFAIGTRIEHSQEWLDRVQYGTFAGHPALGAADYRLKDHRGDGRSAYTFCMCPGGEVVAAASEAGGVLTNGMSYQARGARNANAALLVQVGPDDFSSDHPLAGIEYQRIWEHRAYELGGGTYYAPAQRAGDFIEKRPSMGAGDVSPSYRPGVVWTDLWTCLPDYVCERMAEAIGQFDRKLPGFANADAVLTGVETRSSSPVRILRGEGGRSVNLAGLYPAGEGAGYAGGILSSAVDGLRIAEHVIRG
jgi:uncharacterized FAD-dependent dehydrogenase